MAPDEQFVSSSNSAGSGESGVGAVGTGDGGVNTSTNNNNKSKTGKQKKVPQRGLGVAQLERLRLEEQRKREANALTNNAIGSARCPNFGPNTVPAPLPSANSSFSAPNASNLHGSVVGLSGPTNRIKKNEMGLRGVSSWPGVLSGEHNNANNYYCYNVDGEGGDKHRVDDQQNVGFAFDPQVKLNLQYEPNGPGLPVPGSGPIRSFQFQRPPSSSVVNVSSGISQSSFSCSQTEFPSIQSVRVDNYISSWSEDDKNVVGMKRAYPFSLENLPVPTPSFLSNFHASGCGSDEFQSRSKYIRDGQLSLTPGPEQNPVEDTRLIGDFLTLAPPVAASTPLSSKNNNLLLDYFGHQGLGLSDNRSSYSQENPRSSPAYRVGPSTSAEQPFSFFPIKLQTDQATARVRNNNGEKGEKLDLNLKL